MNTYGTTFRLTTYGESHGLAVGAIIDGCPAGVAIDMEAIDAALTRRRQGAPRQEEDRIVWLSGILDGVTLGTPLAFEIHNLDTRPADYDGMDELFRPGHADYTYYMKYGLRDHRGGGRSSARETVARVVAGCIARQLMPEVEIKVDSEKWHEECPDDTVGGVVKCCITGVPAGIGEPLYGKLNAQLAAAMMSIPSAIGFEMGAGFAAAKMTGSEYIDRWNSSELGIENSELKNDSELTLTNHCGGIQGGISNGMPIEFRVAFHPVVTLPQTVECMHQDGHLQSRNIGGRHDRCHVDRAAAVVEAMAALCLINYML